MNYSIKHIQLKDSSIHILKWITMPDNEELKIKSFKSQKRNREKTAEIILLESINKPSPKYLDSGKPTYKNEFISITHSHDYVAIYIHKTKEIGIDIEKIHNKVNRISDKFIRNDENWITSTTDKTTAWSCKESVYKYFDIEGLDFKKQIKLVKNDNEIIAQVTLQNSIIEIPLKLSIFDNMVLTYTY